MPVENKVIEVEYKRKIYKILDYSDYCRICKPEVKSTIGEMGYTKTNYDIAYDLLKTIYDKMMERKIESGANKKEIIEWAEAMLALNICIASLNSTWLYGIKIKKAYMKEVLNLIDNKYPDNKLLWADVPRYYNCNIIIVNEKEFMKVNDALTSDIELMKKCGLDFETKSPLGYVDFVKKNDNARQTIFLTQDEYDLAIPIMLTDNIDFELYHNKSGDRGMVYKQESERAALNCFYNSVSLGYKEKQGLINDRNLKITNKGYLINNVDYSNKNTKYFIAPYHLCNYGKLIHILFHSSFKLYHKDYLIGERQL